MGWAGLSPVPLGVWVAEAGLRFQLCTHIPTCGGLPVPSALRDTGWVVRQSTEAACQGRRRPALQARPWEAQVRLGPQGWAGVGHRRVTQEALPSAVRHLPRLSPQVCPAETQPHQRQQQHLLFPEPKGPGRKPNGLQRKGPRFPMSCSHFPGVAASVPPVLQGPLESRPRDRPLILAPAVPSRGLTPAPATVLGGWPQTEAEGPQDGLAWTLRGERMLMPVPPFGAKEHIPARPSHGQPAFSGASPPAWGAQGALGLPAQLPEAGVAQWGDAGSAGRSGRRAAPPRRSWWWSWRREPRCRAKSHLLFRLFHSWTW